MWFKMTKFIRRITGRCPYCGKRMLNGMGGSSLLFLGGLKICPDKHYAEELHMTGATLIHDNGGEPLPIKMIGDE